MARKVSRKFVEQVQDRSRRNQNRSVEQYERDVRSGQATHPVVPGSNVVPLFNDRRRNSG